MGKKPEIDMKCYNCGYDLTGVSTFGLIDSTPVYIRCPSCRAINNYHERVMKFKEEQERKKQKRRNKRRKKHGQG